MIRGWWKQLKIIFYEFYRSGAWKVLVATYVVALIGGLSISWWEAATARQGLTAQVTTSAGEMAELQASAEQYRLWMQEDQVVKNASLSAEMKNIQSTYNEGAKLFEARADLAVFGGKVSSIDNELAKFLNYLSLGEWQKASEQSDKVQGEIDKLAASLVPKAMVATAPVSNTLAASGYSRQKVVTERGEFVVAMVVAPGARVMVETASESDCSDNCPTKSLAEHIAAAGGFAGINGAYFCPPDYARCQGKVNSFDTLAVSGRTKAVLNRANNVYSTIPLVAAYGTSLSFYDQTLQWGVDTSSGGALANYPRLLRDGSIATDDNSSKGMRGFIGGKDGGIVIGHVYSASYADTAEVLRTLGLQNALNLDGGGSSALWYEGAYRVGPGRSLPTAIVLVR